MDFNERAAAWFQGLSEDRQAEVRAITGPLPSWAVESIKAAGIPVIAADMPRRVMLMPSSLRSFLDDPS